MITSNREEIEWLMKNTNLCGSRYFALKFPDIIKIDKDSDWDFYVQETDEIYNTLIDRGYTPQLYNQGDPAYHGDELLSCIMINTRFPYTQVLLRTDAKLYTKVIKSISPEFYRDYLWKSGPNYCIRENIQNIFNQLFRTARND